MELALITLSSSLFSASHLFLNPNPKPPLLKFHINNPRFFTVCKSTEFKTEIDAESYASSSQPDGLGLSEIKGGNENSRPRTDPREDGDRDPRIIRGMVLAKPAPPCPVAIPRYVGVRRHALKFTLSSSMELALITLSSSLFSASHLFLNPNPKPPLLKFHINNPRFFTVCKSTEFKTEIDAESYASSSQPDGLGLSAPTRGDVYLQRHQSPAASASVLSEMKKKRKNNKDKASLKGSFTVHSCYGCGAPLQTTEHDSPGYVEPETYDLKKKHRQLRTVICGRCRLLSHGHMITAVGGNGGYAGGKQFITAEELREKLSHLRLEKALIVKLVDVVDFNGSFLSRIRDIAGSNPIILVVTKVDLLPKGTDLNCVGDWVVEATMKKKLNVLSVHLTSSKSLVGITGVVSEIQREKKGRDVYILGSANVGKSAFINALLKIMSYKDPVALAAQRYKPIQSAVPGTTLGPIQIDAFLGGGKLYDTPGVHLHHRQAAVVHSEDLPALAARSRLRGLPIPNPQLSLDKSMADRIRSNGLIGFSIFWGGLLRIDIIKVLPETRLTFYGPKALQLHMVPTEEAEEFYWKEIGTLLTPPTGKMKAENWAGLEAIRELQLKYQDIERPSCDIAISGLGWISVEPFSQFLKSSDPSEVEDSGVIALNVHLPKPVEIFVRPPLPVGDAGGKWYQYSDLTEKEEEVRPKWYF
ncbi:nitric oxide synthase [Dorcoceras hygrometricum]|uniref:Nitric oxide synthase n=1 Tax=Dorcoceras hygrometricum TaxID=472368 RepID=A0A2Z7C9R2_9LAMI|nr:nitric oxide synthase [Dorcoceras hygrometricum]